jgi:hypothetical protein
VRYRAFVALALIVACSGSDAFVDGELGRKESGQLGPKIVITRGRLPDGNRWLFTAYRRARKQICYGQSWEEKEDRGHSYEGKCTQDNEPRTVIQNDVTYPGKNDEFQYMTGIVMGTRARTLRARFRDGVQSFRLIRNAGFPGEAFFIGRIAPQTAPQTMELIDASGAVLLSEPYRP